MTSSSSLPPDTSRNNTQMPHIEDAPYTQQVDPNTEAERRERIRIKNRRKLYLDRNPSYFTFPDLELTGCIPRTTLPILKLTKIQILSSMTAVSDASSPQLREKPKERRRATPVY